MLALPNAALNFSSVATSPLLWTTEGGEGEQYQKFRNSQSGEDEVRGCSTRHPSNGRGEQFFLLSLRVAGISLSVGKER